MIIIEAVFKYHDYFKLNIKMNYNIINNRIIITMTA